VVDVLDDQSILVPEASLPPNRRWLNRLKLLGSGLLQDFREGFQRFDPDGETRRLKRRPFFGGSGDDQHLQAWRGDGGQFQTCFRIAESQGLLARQQSFVKGDGGLDRVAINKYALV
jgi:hypothetical protein